MFVRLLIVCLLTFVEKVVSIETENEIIKLNKDICLVIDKYMDARTQKFGLTMSQGIVLLRIIDESKVGIADASAIINYADTSKSTVSAILKKLCAKGFITFEPFEKDNRRKKIVPTQKAMRVKNKLCREFENVNRELFCEFSDEELEYVCKFHRALLKAVKQSFKNYKETEES